MKLLHTSDWHIGRSLFEFSLLEDQQEIFRQIASIIEHEQVDAVLISGDLYDRSMPSAQAVSLLDEMFTTLISRYHLPILAISGNHDSARRVAYGSRLFEQSGLYLAGGFSMQIKRSPCRMPLVRSTSSCCPTLFRSRCGLRWRTVPSAPPAKPLRS